VSWRYLIENCTGTLKLMEPCFISGGKAGNGWARRTIANVSPSSAACPDDPASRLQHLTAAAETEAQPCNSLHWPAAFAPGGYA
jgi:hypothetical protein